MTDSTAHLPERRDARRNREAVIDAAITLLADQPEATMTQVAAASGVGRTTVYRHFPHRDDLLRALYRRVVEDAHAVVTQHVERSRADGASDVLPTLVAMVGELSGLGDRYRFLDGRREATEELDAMLAEAGPEPLASYVAEGQASGQLSAELTVDWILELLHHLTVMTAAHLRAGTSEPAAGARMLNATLRGALSGRP